MKTNMLILAFLRRKVVKVSSLPTHTIRKGQQLYRVLTAEYDQNGNRLYDALEPNPYTYVTFDEKSDVKARFEDNTLVSGRFAPFRSSKAEHEAVPALYFAESAIGAYYEIILRPLGNKAKRAIELADVENKVLARVILNKNLKLADIRRPYLKGGQKPFWEYTAEDLYESSNLKVIKETRSLSKYVHDNYPELDGLIWDSVQAQGPVTCMILFGFRRTGRIEEEIEVLSDISTWRPYLLEGVRNGEIIVAPDLVNILEL